jgi:hypothetical protein
MTMRVDVIDADSMSYGATIVRARSVILFYFCQISVGNRRHMLSG